MGSEEAIYFLVVLFWPKVTLWALAAGRWGCLVFFVIRVTPPFSAGITPTAYTLISIVSNATYVVTQHTLSFTNPACCVRISPIPQDGMEKCTFLEWVLVKLRGSRDSLTPPPVLRFTRKEFWFPAKNQIPTNQHLSNSLSRKLMAKTYGQSPRSSQQTPGSSGGGREQSTSW